MRASSLLILSILLVVHSYRPSYFVPLALWSQAAQSATSVWKEYTSRDGKFAVLLPGSPTIGTKPIGSYSPISRTYVTNLQVPPFAFMVEYFDLPTPLSTSSDVKRLMDETRNRVVKTNLLESVSEKDIARTDYPERTLKAVLPNGETFLSRMLLVKQRFYQVGIVIPSDQIGPDFVSKYFDSFKPTPLTDAEIKNLKSFASADNESSIPVIIRFSEEVLRHSAIKKVQPSYPAEARSSEISGEVRVEVVISEEGKVTKTKVISGPEQFRDAAVEAARQWKFKPRIVNGGPVKMIGVLTFRFGSK